MDVKKTAKPHLTVAAVVESKGLYLVVEELAGGGEVINQPAGHVEQGESLRNAIIRETHEETAWDFEPTAIVGVYLWTHPDTGEQFLRVVYTGRVSGHKPDQELDEGILRAVWYTRDELLARQARLRSPMVLRAIDDYLDGHRYPVTMFQQIELEELARQAELV